MVEAKLGAIIDSTDSGPKPVTSISDRSKDGPVIGANGPGGGPETIAGFEAFDPAGIGGGGAPAGAKRRGRPPGSRNAAPAQTAERAPDLAGIEKVLLSIHMMGAAFFQTPELALDASEAKLLTIAITDVVKYYPIGLSKKALAWINLCLVAGGMYGTRFMAISARHKMQSKLRIVSLPKQQEKVSNGFPAPKSAATSQQPMYPNQVFGPTNPEPDDTAD